LPQLPQTFERHFWVGMPARAQGVVGTPFLLLPSPVDQGVHVAYIALREFGEIVGDLNPSWNDENGRLTAQVTGTHRDGSTVTVVVERGRHEAIIYRAGGEQQIVDIAAFVEGASGTRVYPHLSAEGNFFLPLRFFAQAFGFNVSWDGATSQVTLRG